MKEEVRPLNLRQIAFVAMRLISLYVLTQTLFYLPDTVRVVVGGDFVDPFSWPTLAGFILFLTSAFLLWNQASRLAQSATRGADEEVMETSISVDAIELVAFSVLGVFILVNSIPRLGSDIAQMIAPSTFDQFVAFQGPPDNYRSAKLLEAVATLGRVLLGIWLMLGTNSFVSWMRRIRERARSGPSFEDVDPEDEEQ